MKPLSIKSSDLLYHLIWKWRWKFTWTCFGNSEPGMSDSGSPVYPLDVLALVWKVHEGTGTNPYPNNLRLKFSYFIIQYQLGQLWILFNFNKMLIVHKKNDVILYNWPMIGSIHLIWQMVGQYDVIFLDTLISFFSSKYVY